MEKLVWEYITEQGLIQEGQNVGAATSGGPDSMALLVCLCSLAAQHGFSVYCVHFEHGIRGERSLQDADFVTEYCDTHHIPLFMGAADVPALAEKWGQSEETAAKRAREAYFDSLIAQGDIDVMATAHHQNDNAESILMHILRGSGLSGLRGIHSRFGGMIRPFLPLTRKRILRFVNENAIPYVLDETNSDITHRRNYIRNVLLPDIEEHINADVSAALVRLSSLAQADVDYLGIESAKAFDDIAAVDGDTIAIDAARLNALHPAIASRVVLQAVRALHVTQDIEYAHVMAVLRLAYNDRTGTRVNLSRNICAQIEYGTLLVGFTGREIDYSFNIRFDPADRNELPDGSYITCAYTEAHNPANADKNSECFDADKLPKDLALRTRHTGDVIHPLGAGGEKKLKDYFIDKKLSRSERSKTPLLTSGKNIVWAVGHTISDKYKVTEDTKRILRLQYIAKKEEQHG
ncbi:tRNA lysidine(34) synthetase TilS [Christensenellaceae bacterium OttesenSCG-928-K19]|nr:tRNA lysidine(34) synthetase TilS [Christensenellaceae bacterium OttesenSCG-928-K19]